MKRIFTLLALLIAVSNLSFSEPIKRVLFEQHTGTWCGWCVDGTYKLEQILQAHPDVVIPVKLHNGASDKMSLPVQLEIANGLTIPGYPAGCIDRTKFGGTYFPDRIVSSSDYSLNAWMPLVEERLNQAPKLDISALLSYDEETRNMKITVTVTMLETVSGNLKFNAYIIEDSVKGSGSGWDQANYLSGRAGWEFSPYYNLPNPVPNYYHRHVVRDLLGGAWGVTGEFTNPAEANEVFVHEFNKVLDASWNLDKIEVVAFVTEDVSKEVMNVCYGSSKPPTPPVMELTVSGPDVGVLNDGDTYVRNFNIKNISETEQNFQATMSVSPSTPTDWLAELPKSEVTVAPGETESLIVRLTSGPTVGLSEVKITIASLTEPSAPKTSGSMIGISKNIENFEVINKSEETNTLLPYKSDEKFYFNIASKDFSKLYDKLPNINSVIWNLGDADVLGQTDVNAISGLISKGTNIALYGYKVLSSLQNGAYLDDLGLQYYGYCQEGYVDGYNNYVTWLKGCQGDPLTGSMADKILYLERKTKEIYVCKITDVNNTHPVLVFKNDQTVYTGGTNTENSLWDHTICGFRIDKGNSKIVIIGINPLGLMVETYRDNLINKPLEWFEGAIGVDDKYWFSSNLSLSVSPNPVEGIMTINFNNYSDKAQNCSIALCNNLGQEFALIYNGTLNKGSNTFRYNTSALPDGSYHLILKSADRVSTTPVIILK
jgi:hypothetical protein